MQCVVRLTEAFERAGVTVGGLTPDSKEATVSYDPTKTSVQVVAATASRVQPVHGQPYIAGMLITITDLQKSEGKLKGALGRVRGVANYRIMDAEAGKVAVLFSAPPTRPDDHATATKIAQAISKVGITYSGIDGVEVEAAPAVADSKKKSTAAKSKTKPDAEPPTAGAGDETEKPKPKRATPKPKADAEPPDPGEPEKAEKPKDPEKAADKPNTGESARFQIMAFANGKVFLKDTDANLKQFVSKNDKFGDFIVKEIDEKAGKYVILEDAEKKTTRVERK